MTGNPDDNTVLRLEKSVAPVAQDCAGDLVLGKIHEEFAVTVVRECVIRVELGPQFNGLHNSTLATPSYCR